MTTNITSIDRATPDVVRLSPSSGAAGKAASPQTGEQGFVNARPTTPSPAELDGAVKEFNDYVQSISRNLEFSVDKDANRTVIRVVDSQTGDVVRQIPAEEMLQLARHLREMDKASEGLFIKTQA